MTLSCDVCPGWKEISRVTEAVEIPQRWPNILNTLQQTGHYYTVFAGQLLVCHSLQTVCPGPESKGKFTRRDQTPQMRNTQWLTEKELLIACLHSDVYSMGTEWVGLFVQRLRMHTIDFI